MSADPYIQAPDNLQSYNRYAYVMNNPLNLTDPGGYLSFRSFFKGVVKIFAPVIAALPKPIASTLINVASLACGTWAPACAGAGQAALAYYHGASAGDAFRVGVRAGATAFLFQQAGLQGKADSPERYLAHASAGCVSAVASGGNCGQGALSAVVGKYATNASAGLGNSFGAEAARFAIAVTAGGVRSVIAGGKFANGAETAAYGYLFNHLNGFSQSNAKERNMFDAADEYLATKKGSSAYYISAHAGREGVHWKDDGVLTPQELANKVLADPTFTRGMTVVILLLRPDEVSSRISNALVLKVAHHALR